MKKLVVPAVAVISLLLFSASAQQESGVVGGFPPEDLFLHVTTGPNGEPIVSANEFQLALGGYYRFNFVCPDAVDDASGFHFESEGLVMNSHIRVYSVGDIELYLQGQTFRAIQCDEAGAARFSFHPMRRGVYEFLVRDHSDPPQAEYGKFIVE